MHQPIEEEQLCDKCIKNEKQEAHTCPFLSEIHDDYETLCTCCGECENECARDV